MPSIQRACKRLAIVSSFAEGLLEQTSSQRALQVVLAQAAFTRLCGSFQSGSYRCGTAVVLRNATWLPFAVGFQSSLYWTHHEPACILALLGLFFFSWKEQECSGFLVFLPNYTEVIAKKISNPSVICETLGRASRSLQHIFNRSLGLPYFQFQTRGCLSRGGKGGGYIGL